MSTILLIAAIACAVGAVASLLTGVVGLGTKEFNDKYGNKLMRARVAFQFGAIMFLFLYWLSIK